MDNNEHMTTPAAACLIYPPPKPALNADSLGFYVILHACLMQTVFHYKWDARSVFCQHTKWLETLACHYFVHHEATPVVQSLYVNSLKKQEKHFTIDFILGFWWPMAQSFYSCFKIAMGQQWALPHIVHGHIHRHKYICYLHNIGAWL